MFHDDDLGSICTDDIPGIDQCPGKESTNDCQDEEPNIGAVSDGRGGGGVNILTKGNLGKLAFVDRKRNLV